MNQTVNGHKVSPTAEQSGSNSFDKGEVGQSKTPLTESFIDRVKPSFDLSLTRITDETDVPPVVATVTIKGGIFAVKGDLGFISGLPKSGKSTVSRYIIGTSLMPTISEEFDSLGIRAVYCEGRPVVYIDSEQPKAYTKRMGEEIKKMLCTDRLPDNLHLYNWRHHTHLENRQAIEQLFSELPDAAYWIVDGITDFVGGANEEKEGNETIRFFMGVASRLNTTIILLIHENSGGGKMRGHIGSEAERKCGGAITIRKDRENGVHWIEPKLIRGSADFEKYAFFYDSNKHGFSLCDDDQTKTLRESQKKRSARKEELYQLASLIFCDNDELPKSQIMEGLKKIVVPKDGQKPDAYRKFIDRIFNQMVDEYNILTPFGAITNSFRYLPPIVTNIS